MTVFIKNPLAAKSRNIFKLDKAEKGLIIKLQGYFMEPTQEICQDLMKNCTWNQGDNYWFEHMADIN